LTRITRIERATKTARGEGFNDAVVKRYWLAEALL